MRKLKSKHVGPISYFWGPKKKFLDAYLTGYENASYGWEWGCDEYIDKPFISLRLFGLQIVYFEKFRRGGFELWLFGFWWIT